MNFYHDGMRELQDRYEGRAVADRIEDLRMHTTFTDEDRHFIEPGFPRWMTNLMTCFADSAIRINAIPSALRANPMSPGG